MKYHGACADPACRTTHEWILCGQCDDPWGHCVFACPVPQPIYERDINIVVNCAACHRFIGYAERWTVHLHLCQECAD